MAKRILIIDDEKEMTDLLSDFFTGKGYETFTANSARDGLEVVKKERPLVVLLDIKLPEMSGIEVLKKIKETDPAIGAIIITGIKDEKTAEEAIELGASDYITKPLSLEYLESSVMFKIYELCH